MRVAIDEACLRPPLTGIGHFVRRLMGAMLPLLSPDDELLAFSNKWGLQLVTNGFLSRVDSSNAAQALGEASPLCLAPKHGRAYRMLRQTYLGHKAAGALAANRFRAAQKNFDLFHAVNYIPPAGLYKPALPIIHDLSHIRYPHLHPNDRVHWLESNFRSTLEAPYIQTISEFTKTEIASVLGIASERIYVTYAAPGEYYRPEPAGDGAYLDKYGLLARHYFLVVGTREPRKNFTTVAQAYLALPEKVKCRFPLLWVGVAGWGDMDMSLAMTQAVEAGQIRMMGYIPDRDLAAIYRNTTLFLMPSIYEGFGMPVVEALACHAPAAISRIPVFEEIARGCARYVDPLDIERWRCAMQDAVDAGGAPITNGEESANLARFSWHASAGITLDLYRRLLSAVGKARSSL